jgi:hypothetical protein
MQSRNNPKKKQKQTINKNKIKTLCKVDTTQSKNESKLSTKVRWRPYAKRTHDYKITMNDDKEELKQKSLTIFGLNLWDQRPHDYKTTMNDSKEELKQKSLTIFELNLWEQEDSWLQNDNEW